MEDVPEDRPPLEEKAAGGVDCNGVGGDLALSDEGLGGGLQVALHQVVVDVDVEPAGGSMVVEGILQIERRQAGDGAGGRRDTHILSASQLVRAMDSIRKSEPIYPPRTRRRIGDPLPLRCSLEKSGRRGVDERER